MPVYSGDILITPIGGTNDYEQEIAQLKQDVESLKNQLLNVNEFLPQVGYIGNISPTGVQLYRDVYIMPLGVTIRVQYRDTSFHDLYVFTPMPMLPGVDIRRFTIYDSSSQGTTFDGVTLTPEPLKIDDGLYNKSNDNVMVWIKIGKMLYHVYIYISATGVRSSITYQRIT